MIIKTTAKSILRKHKKIDSWFLSSYAINLYRGCTHNCVYCDGRNEKYGVDGEFGRDITVKENAVELLEKECDPARKRKPFSNGLMSICGGVSDSYQPFERTENLCRRVLEILYRYGHPVHMLTKSTLIERDIDLLKKINQQNCAVVSFSFSSVDDEVSRLLEPGASAPSQRLQTIKKCKDEGINCGVYLMPVVPFITDSAEAIEVSVSKAVEAGAEFILFSGMTLKAGRQKDYFMDFIRRHFPDCVDKYNSLYSDDAPWGAPKMEYIHKIEKIFCEATARYRIPKRMPSRIFKSLVSPTELVLLILEQLDYLVTLQGKKSPYGFAAYALSKTGRPVETLRQDELLKVKGIGPFTAQIIQEIIETGRCGYYEKIL